MCEVLELEPHHERLLLHACECLDRIEQARRQITKKGLVIAGKQGHRANPALAVEKEQKKLFAQLCRELRLDHDSGGGHGDGVRRPRQPEKGAKR